MLFRSEIRASVSITSSNTSPSTFDHYDGILIGQLGVWRYCHYDFHSGLIQTSETSIAGSMLQRGGVHEAGLMYVNGNYEMNAGSLNSGNLILAKTNYDNGYFYQNGGSVVAADVIVGNAGSSYYRLNGDLDCAYLAVNSNSTFDQVAGRTTVAGDVLVTSSTFNLLAGSINGQSLSLRTGAWFRQQDGTATFAGDLTLNRGHVVIDAGSLTAGKAVMGIASDTYTSTFRQNGGLTSFSSLFIDKTAIYTADGGELRVDNGLAIDGRLDVGTSAEFRLHVGSGLVDLAGQVTNLHRLSYSAGAGSITILPAGFSAGDFASCQVEGIIVQAGQLLSIGPNQPLALAGTIRTPVETRSDITAAAGRSLTFAEGLYIDNATVQTGVGGMVQARNATSGINGGLLTTSSLRTTDSGSVFTVDGGHVETQYITVGSGKIGRASCRERV